MILEITLGIVLAVLILANLPVVLALAMYAVVGVIGLAVLAMLVIFALDERWGPPLLALVTVVTVLAGISWVIGRIRPGVERTLGIDWYDLLGVFSKHGDGSYRVGWSMRTVGHLLPLVASANRPPWRL